MISCSILEQPGKWRIYGIFSGLLLALAPAFVLVVSLGVSPSSPAWFDSGFGLSVIRTLLVAGVAGVATLLIGLPCGILGGLYEFPLRRLFLGLVALPLLVPSFLWAIGLSMLRVALGLPSNSFLSGFPGTVIAFTITGLPLVVFVAMIAVRGISKGQMDAARLAGGERFLFRQTLRNVFPATAMAAVLAAVLTLSDPAPGQILGYRGAASQMLTSFSALYDFSLAARQCLVLAVIVLAITFPIAAGLGPRLAEGLLALDVQPAPLTRHPTVSRIAPWFFLALISLMIAAPLAGLVQPLIYGFQFSRAISEALRTIESTLVYGITAGLLATIMGSLMALCAGRNRRLRSLLVAGLFIVIALPPSLGALGYVYTASNAPASLDFIFRSRFTVGLWLALRLFPIACVFAMRRLGTSSPSWANAAALHGVSLPRFLFRVVCPWLFPAAMLSGLLIALLAVADVSSVLLLHPPGQGSLPLAIFTVMANAPESLVASLCLVYIGGAAMLLTLGCVVIGFLKQLGLNR
ncbi:MAG: ABC transporter permease subunit [Verrucomicrobia bacterium]|nr:ABC transporter permease subunit [Verrucomicrobiota bacterium]